MIPVRRAIRKTGKRALQRLLVTLAERWNYYLVRGHVHAENRLNCRRLISGDWFTCVDLVRNAMVEVLSREIYRRHVGGAVAEVGVYQGEFAALINAYFHDRTLYLFDTFSGFDPRDTHADQGRGYSSADWDFSNTTVDLVLSKMSHKDNVVIKKGYFPESAMDCDEAEFCLVSLDVDLYQPTYAGLKWFYPRLAPGGYLLVHDYESAGYRGVKRAVDEFAAETGISSVLLPDMVGSLVIAKPYTGSVRLSAYDNVEAETNATDLRPISGCRPVSDSPS